MRHLKKIGKTGLLKFTGIHPPGPERVDLKIIGKLSGALLALQGPPPPGKGPKIDFSPVYGLSTSRGRFYSLAEAC